MCGNCYDQAKSTADELPDADLVTSALALVPEHMQASTWLRYVLRASDRTVRRWQSGASSIDRETRAFLIHWCDMLDDMDRHTLCALLTHASATQAEGARVPCPDCGEPGELPGHMGCLFPEDR